MNLNSLSTKYICLEINLVCSTQSVYFLCKVNCDLECSKKQSHILVLRLKPFYF